jgi:ketosteroid isomerase-like protein
MSREQNAKSARGRRWPTRTLVGSAAVVLLVTPGIAGPGANDHVQAMAADDLNLQRTFVEYFNARKFDELAGLYEEDAIALPPNHEPVKGRAAIKEYWQSIRDAVGEVKCGEPARVTVSGNLVSLAGDNCSAYGGGVRITYSELYVRQADGTLRYRVDMFGMR